MSLPPERIDATHDFVYLAKHPFYEFTLTRATPSCPGPNPEPPLVQLRFTNQPQQQRIVLTLPALEQFHDALSRLLDYVEQERPGRTATPSSDTSMEGPLAPASERRNDSTNRDDLQGHHPVARLNHPASTGWLCSLSGVVLTGLIALLSWALYSLSTGKGEFRPLQATAAQETPLPSPAAAISHGTQAQEEAGIQQLPPNGDVGRVHRIDDAGELPSRNGMLRQPPLVPSPRAMAQAGSTPHIHLYVQFPAQHEAAQRLAAQLEQKGYLLPKAAILVAEGPSRTEVRYFRTAEAEEATALAVLLHEAYRPPVTTRYIRGHENASHGRPPHYEIWLGTEPR